VNDTISFVKDNIKYNASTSSILDEKGNVIVQAEISSTVIEMSLRLCVVIRRSETKYEANDINVNISDTIPNSDASFIK
jgi:hypothetical protein